MLLDLWVVNAPAAEVPEELVAEEEAVTEEEWEEIFEVYREDDKIILQTEGGGPSRGWAINDHNALSL